MRRNLHAARVLLHQLDGEVLRPHVSSQQADLFGGALLVGDLVDHVLGHLAPGRPLPSGDEDHAGLGVLGDHVVPAGGGAGRSVGVDGERPPASPRGAGKKDREREKKEKGKRKEREKKERERAWEKEREEEERRRRKKKKEGGASANMAK